MSDSTSTDSADEAIKRRFNRHFGRYQKRNNRLERKRVVTKSDSDVSDADADLASTVAQQTVQGNPRCQTDVDDFSFVKDSREFTAWQTKQRAGQLWSDVSKRYYSLSEFTSRVNGTTSRRFLIPAAQIMTTDVSRLEGRGFGVVLCERDVPRDASPSTAVAHLSHDDQSDYWEVADFVSVPSVHQCGFGPLVVDHGLGLRSVCGSGKVSKEAIQPKSTLGLAPGPASPSTVDATRFVQTMRNRMSVMEIDAELNVTPLWGFGLAPFTTHSFTGPTAVVDGEGSIAALCDDSIVIAQGTTLRFLRARACTAIAAKDDHTLLVGKRSGEVAVADPRVHHANGISVIGNLGRVPHTTVCTQVVDATALCAGLPCVIARGVNGSIALFDLRRSGKHTSPCLSYCEPIDPSYVQCDLSAGMFVLCNVQRGRQLRPSIGFSGGFHRFVALDIATGSSLVDVNCDGCVYSARLHVSSANLDVQPRWGGSCNPVTEGSLTEIVCVSARRVTRHDISLRCH